MRPQVFRADRLREERDRRGLTQHELSSLIGAGKSQIAKYENGIGEPSVFQLVRIARALRVSTDYLLGLSDDRHREIRLDELSSDEQRFLAALDSEELGPVLRRLVTLYPEEVLRPQEGKQSSVASTKIATDS